MRRLRRENGRRFAEIARLFEVSPNTVRRAHAWRSLSRGAVLFGKKMLMATMNVSLPDPMKSWGEAQAKSGRCGNVSDYVRHLIRRHQERQAAIPEIRELLNEGLASGPAT